MQMGTTNYVLRSKNRHCDGRSLNERVCEAYLMAGNRHSYCLPNVRDSSKFLAN